MNCIRLSESLGLKLTKGRNRRVICAVNDMAPLHAAILRSDALGFYVNISNTACKKMGIRVGSTVKATVKIDDSEYQFQMPDEFAEVLDTDPEAMEIFKSLTDGNKRSLIFLVSQIKNTDKRIERALKIADKLRNGIKSPQKMLK